MPKSKKVYSASHKDLSPHSCFNNVSIQRVREKSMDKNNGRVETQRGKEPMRKLLVGQHLQNDLHQLLIRRLHS